MGIGWNEKTLLEMLSESERLFKETGHYYGVRELKLKEEDPFRWMQAYAKIRGALVTAREVAIHISASPIVRSIGELAFVLYTPEGDAIAHSTGILVHVHTMSEDIKFMIRNGYEDDPGIREGDIFTSNDPSIGNVHTTDVHTLIPIFYDGELVAWAGGVTHEVDIGGVIPGHDISASTSRYEDGFYVTSEKTGENDLPKKDWKIRSQRGTRAPLYFDLDEKCRIAGLYMIKRFLLRFIEEEGIDYYKKFIREVIEQGRRDLIERVKERLIPGRYRAASFSDTPFANEAWQPVARIDHMGHLPVEITIDGEGRLRMSMDGASAPVPFPWNSSEAAMQGGLWVQLTQLLVHNAIVNDGSYYAMEYDFPAGTWCNPQDYQLSYQCPWYYLIPSFTGMQRCISRGFLARGYWEEVVCGYGMTGDATQGGGLLSGEVMGEPENFYFPVATFEISCTGLGASAVKDGLDHGYAMWNPEGDMGDAEDWERIERGFRFLGRRLMPNSAGYGKYRGGSGWEILRVLFGVRSGVQLFSLRDGYAFFGAGLCGGYPASAGFRLFVRNTDLKERIERREPYPLGERDPENSEIEQNINGEVTRLEYATTYPRVFGEGDLFHYWISGGPGFGDPLDRDYELCEKDANEGIYTPDILEKVYGVVVERIGDKWIVNRDKSEKKREEIRKMREKRSMSFEEFWEYERKKIVNGEIKEHVKRMYRESISLSKKWGDEFKKFWKLPEDFEM
jgi:N-methylhydantoinase B/acetone carboxylase alpha subunit